MSRSLIVAVFLLTSCAAFAQRRLPVVENASDASASGLRQRVDSMYLSAIHVDTSKAVFKSAKEQDALMNAYQDFLQDFGDYLYKNKFKWEGRTKCWNRIYFGPDGTVDYYIFNFKTEISDEKTLRFKELFTAFAVDHKIGVKASVGFAQCSPVTYVDK